jgi:hypothetical protein
MSNEVKIPSIKLNPVKSSQIAAVGYDDKTKTMAIKYASGGTYHYEGVEAKAFEEFKGAKSLGSHFNKTFRSHKFTKLPEEKKKK